MTDAPKKLNGKTGWFALAGSVPIVAIATWAFATGGYCKRVDRLETDTTELRVSDSSQERRLVRLEAIFERTAQDIKDINRKLDRMSPCHE